MDLKEFFLKQKQASYKNSLKVFQAIPPDQLDWRPAADMLSLGQIVRHVGMSEAGVRRVAIENVWEYYEKRVPLGLFKLLGEVTSVPDELSVLERIHQETMSAVEAFPIERWEEERRNDAFGVRTKVVVMLFGINEHNTHHRAQVGTYLHILTGQRASHYAL